MISVNNLKFVCLIVRDSRYLKLKYPQGNWDYHNSRDRDIKDFNKLCEHITTYDYHLFRMGSEVEEKLISKNEKIIDYANSKNKSDFLDVYLASRCDYLISSGLGYDALGVLFKKYILFLDIMPLMGMNFFYSNALTTLTKYFSIDNNKYLSLQNIFDQNLESLSTYDDLKKKNIKLEKSDGNDYDDYFDELYQIKNNIYKFSKFEDELHNEFVNILSKNFKKKGYFKNMSQIKIRISPKFLLKNQYLLE